MSQQVIFPRPHERSSGAAAQCQPRSCLEWPRSASFSHVQRELGRDTFGIPCLWSHLPGLSIGLLRLELSSFPTQKGCREWNLLCPALEKNVGSPSESAQFYYFSPGRKDRLITSPDFITFCMKEPARKVRRVLRYIPSILRSK